ncbi:hypothetical protein [Escherichia coli]|uniref:hypothetical protein n=1 Tax=Escherichia coli TaxID=562 RepID=UPI000BE8DF50|nr:hypothetical protein [Escherichia coli]
MKLFAKDIPYNRKGGTSPREYEKIITEKCKEYNLIFCGFIAPYKGTRTKIAISDGKNEKEILLISFLRKKNNSFKYTDEDAHIEFAKSECHKQGAVFLGWAGGKFDRVENAKMILRCHAHNYVWDTRRYTQLRRNDKIYCPICLGITPEQELRKQAIELCDKHDVDFIDWAEPFKGKETKMHLRCRKHNIEWKKTSFYLVNLRGSCNCPECTARIKVANKMGYYESIDKPHTLYIQLLDDKYIKFGVTCRDPHIRMKEQANKSNFTHKLVFSHTFIEGWRAYDLECEIKDRFKCYAAKYHEMKDGWSETIHIDELSNLQQMIYDYLTNQPEDAGLWVSPKDTIDEENEEVQTYFYGKQPKLEIQVNNEFSFDESLLTFPVSNCSADYSELDLSPLETL